MAGGDAVAVEDDVDDPDEDAVDVVDVVAALAEPRRLAPMAPPVTVAATRAPPTSTLRKGFIGVVPF
jgi:hypothetical protein